MTDTDEEGQQESWACRCGSAAGLKASQEHSEHSGGAGAKGPGRGKALGPRVSAQPGGFFLETVRGVSAEWEDTNPAPQGESLSACGRALGRHQPSSPSPAGMRPTQKGKQSADSLPWVAHQLRMAFMFLNGSQSWKSTLILCGRWG